jgi:hypothetical protein
VDGVDNSLVFLLPLINDLRICSVNVSIVNSSVDFVVFARIWMQNECRFSTLIYTVQYCFLKRFVDVHFQLQSSHTDGLILL